MAETPAANWYPDPFARFEHRYWDGHAWTEHVASAGNQLKDPIAPVASERSVVEASPEVSLPAQRAEPPERPEAGEHKKPGLFGRLMDERRAKVVGRDEFETLAMEAAVGDQNAISQLPSAVEEARTLFSTGKLDAKLWEVMAAAVRHVISDDILSEEEEAHLHELGSILGTPVQSIETRDFALFEELAIAGINDGRFPRHPDPEIMVKKDETAYGSFAVHLMKEVALREFRGGMQSVSIPIAAGVRYRIGSARGRSVVVGTELVAQDSGVLVVTSKRVVFVGQKKTLEFRHDKLVGLEQFQDGLRLNVSNRQTASLFTLATGNSPSIAAALISNASADS